MYYSVNGSTTLTDQSSAYVPEDSTGVRFTRNATTGVITFYTTTDPATTASESVTWTQLGTADTGTTGALFVSSEELRVGHNATINLAYEGIIDRCEIYETIDGTTPSLALDPTDIDTTSDPDAGQSSWVSSTGETWTVNRSTTGLKTCVVTRPVWLFDETDDYLLHPLADNPSFNGTSYTYLMLVRPHNHTTFSMLMANKSSASSKGMYFYFNISGSMIAYPHDGTTGSSTTHSTSNPSDSVLRVCAFRYDATAEELQMFHYHGGTLTAQPSPLDVSAVGDINPGVQARIGQTTGGSLPVGHEIFDVLVFDGVALTETELDAISAQLLAGNYT